MEITIALNNFNTNLLRKSLNCQHRHKKFQTRFQFSLSHVTKMFHHFGHMTFCFCHLEFLNTAQMNAYGRNYRQEKTLDKDIRSLIVNTILSEGGDVTTGY